MAKSAEEQLGVELAEPNRPQVTPEAKEPEAPAPERPEWLPENFDSPEALAGSYKEATKELTQTKQQFSELQQQVADMQAQLDAANEPQLDQNDYEAQLRQAFEQDPVATMSWLAQQAAMSAVNQRIGETQADTTQMEVQRDVVAKLATDEMATRYSDWYEVRDLIAERAKEDPYLIPEAEVVTPQGAVNALDRAYKLVKAEQLMGQEHTAQQAAETARADKLRAQTLTGSSSRPDVSADAEREEHFARLAAAHKGSSYAGLRG